MKRLLSAILLAGICARPYALGHVADVAIIDRDSGAELPTHYYRGEYWVAGAPGARYAISVRNHVDARILAVTAVDGVNVISGENAAYLQTGYVFGGYESYQIDGWRKSDTEVAAFRFSVASGSYASLTGRPGNVGVIGVALFREGPPPTVIAQQAKPNPPESDAPPSSAAGMPSAEANSNAMARAQSLGPLQAERLGTAHGEREQSYVSHTDFRRQQQVPNEIIRIRYDSLQNLIALGVIRSPPSRSTPDPFPASAVAHYVPDPPELR